MKGQVVWWAPPLFIVSFTVSLPLMVWLRTGSLGLLGLGTVASVIVWISSGLALGLLGGVGMMLSPGENAPVGARLRFFLIMFGIGIVLFLVFPFIVWVVLQLRLG